MLILKILGKLALGLVSVYTLVWLIFMIRGLWLPGAFWFTFLGFWLISFISLEVIWLWRKQKPFPRLLKHFRYAPLAILFFSIAVTLLFDATMIEYSKYKIRAYIYSNTSPEEKIELELHSNYRSWCGTGASDHYAWLYGQTAHEGSDSSNPAIRARSLRARMLVFALPLNEIDQADRDEDATVRELAAKFREGNF